MAFGCFGFLIMYLKIIIAQLIIWFSELISTISINTFLSISQNTVRDGVLVWNTGLKTSALKFQQARTYCGTDFFATPSPSSQKTEAQGEFPAEIFFPHVGTAEYFCRCLCPATENENIVTSVSKQHSKIFTTNFGWMPYACLLLN